MCLGIAQLDESRDRELNAEPHSNSQQLGALRAARLGHWTASAFHHARLESRNAWSPWQGAQSTGCEVQMGVFLEASALRLVEEGTKGNPDSLVEHTPCRGGRLGVAAQPSRCPCPPFLCQARTSELFLQTRLALLTKRGCKRPASPDLQDLHVGQRFMGVNREMSPKQNGVRIGPPGFDVDLELPQHQPRGKFPILFDLLFPEDQPEQTAGACKGG